MNKIFEIFLFFSIFTNRKPIKSSKDQMANDLKYSEVFE